MEVHCDFASDNVSGIAPEAMDALVRANKGAVNSYGDDPTTRHAADLIRELLGADAEVRFVVSGTAGNAIALSMLAERFESVLAIEHAHIANDETGAPAFIGGGQGLTRLPDRSGRMDPEALIAALAAPQYARRQSPGALSLTQSTEFGTVYSEEQLGQLIGPAKQDGLGVHMDGAYLAKAAAAGFDMKAIARLGVDILVLSGAKTGMPPTEALVVFDKRRTRRLDARLKQMGHQPSKMRFLSAPWVGMLETGAWLSRAQHANAMARRLAAGMPFPIAHAVETNIVFAHMDEAPYQALQHRWVVHRGLDGAARFVCSWDTRPEMVDALCTDLKGLAATR